MSDPPPPPWQPSDVPPPPPANIPPPPPSTWNYQSPMQGGGGGPSIPFWGQAGFGCLSFFVAVGMAFTLMSIAASVVPDSGGAIFGVLVSPLAALLAAVIVQRRRRPALARPFRVPLYPIVPVFFLVACAGIFANAFREQPRFTLINVAVLAAGLPIDWLWRRCIPMSTLSYREGNVRKEKTTCDSNPDEPVAP